MSDAGEDLAPDDALARLLSAYDTRGAVADELIDTDGNIRPVWLPLLDAIAGMSDDELAQRHARGEQYLADAGVYYRQYGADGATERVWPLSPMPVLIDETEWASIAAGLKQRADLLEDVCADLYGDNRLVAEGFLPATLVADNREWLRPLVGAVPRSGHFLHFLAFDIGRGPNGAWWVLSDRTQAPSGAGFSLENRIATTRIYQDLVSGIHLHRLAGFLRTFRDTLNAMRRADEGRVGIYTPGPMNDTYYEHAYIARYLGFQLLEGDDMVVRDGELMVRTVSGLVPVSVLWRRVDAVWGDPLELDERSTLGTPGMLSAVREGHVTMVNALGSGVLETRAFLAFIPRICQELRGEPLALPNIATWWCGQQREREYVKSNAERMTIGSAFETRMLFDSEDVAIFRGNDPALDRERVAAWIESRRGALVGQEAVTLSTTPAFDGSRLVPRPMTLRVFLARTPDGWEVMPGGFARIGRSSSTRLAMQRGGSAADVWIVSRTPVSTETMMAGPKTPFVRQAVGPLPSRAADNLYWLGRYVERAEHTARLSRAYHARLGEEGPLLEAIREALRAVGSEPDGRFAGGTADALSSAAHAAAAIRDRFSVDGWNALNDLSKTVVSLKRTAAPGDDMANALGVILRKLNGFAGLVHENMYRLTGWHFLTVGRALERATALLNLLIMFADPDAPDGALDVAIEVGDATMTHRRRYAMGATRETVVDLLALDPLNPRAVITQLLSIEEHVSNLPGSASYRPASAVQRAALKARTGLAIETPDTLDTEALERVRVEVAGLSKHLAATYFP